MGRIRLSRGCELFRFVYERRGSELRFAIAVAVGETMAEQIHYSAR